jgi:hypothetical protein
MEMACHPIGVRVAEGDGGFSGSAGGKHRITGSLQVRNCITVGGMTVQIGTSAESQGRSPSRSQETHTVTVWFD